MTVKLIKIGNSKGVRLPKNLIDKYDLTDDLEIVESEDGILIKPVSVVRSGWEQQFKEANNSKVEDDDFSDFDSITTEFDSKEWSW